MCVEVAGRSSGGVWSGERLVGSGIFYRGFKSDRRLAERGWTGSSNSWSSVVLSAGLYGG